MHGWLPLRAVRIVQCKNCRDHYYIIINGAPLPMRNTLKALGCGLFLMMPLSANAEWWHVGFNGVASNFIDIDSIRPVESEGVIKAWTAMVPESSKPKPKSQSAGKKGFEQQLDNAAIKILSYYDCRDWRIKKVQFIAIDKATRNKLYSSPPLDQGYVDIDTADVNNQYAKVVCSADRRKTLRELRWWPADSEDYIAYSAKFMRISQWLDNAEAAKAKGKDPGEPPAEVIEFIQRGAQLFGGDAEGPSVQDAP